jgi:hypothetical protein
LLVVTIALSARRKRFEAECPDFAKPYLPTWESLDEDRFQRMAGGDPREEFRRLEPDILGEYFVLTRLKEIRVGVVRQALIDAGLELAEQDAGVFLYRCALDFPDEWRALGRLVPSRGSNAMRAFAAASIALADPLSEDRFDDLVDIVSQTESLSDRSNDIELHSLRAIAVHNKGTVLGQLRRTEEAIGVYDDLIARFGEASEPALRELVAQARAAREAALDELQLSEGSDDGI